MSETPKPSSVTEGKITFGLVGDSSELTPEAAKAFLDALPHIASFLRFLQSPQAAELEKQYRRGLISESHGFDWYESMRLK